MDVFRNIGSFRTSGIFKNLPSMKNNHAYSKPWYRQNSLFHIFKDIRHIQGYWCIFSHTHTVFSGICQYIQLYSALLKLMYHDISNVGQPHFQIYWKKHWEKILNYWFRKVNIDIINWEKLFDRSTPQIMQYTMTC